MVFAIAVLSALSSIACAEPRHGIARHGEPALPADFHHLPYANPDAPKGGELRQALTGTFDSTNPFIVFGRPVSGVRTYTVESLLARNLAEPFSLYGLIAESIDVSDDASRIAFRIRPSAKFSDGAPVTSADVVFSLETLRDHGQPRFKSYYSKVTTTEAPDALTVVFHQDGGDKELPLILGLMPILSKRDWEGRDFEKTTLAPILGSGPYVMSEIKAGESIVYRRNPGYWGRDLPINRGFWNFDLVRFDYFRDSTATFESFKKGLVDIRAETDPTRWSTGYDFPAVQEGRVIRETIEQRSPAPASGFAFNTRRALFADKRVREALIHAFDFEWANRNLFFNLYGRTKGYFGGSELSSFGVQASVKERTLLGSAAGRIDPSILEGKYLPPVSDGTGNDRVNLRKALSLLEAAGCDLKGTRLVNRATGAAFTFDITIQSREQEKIALFYQRSLRQIGIEATIRTVDSAQFQRLQQSYDYDMIPVTWYNSLSPGNEQSYYYGSEGRTIPGTRNYPGIADPDVDRMIDELLRATTREDLVTAVRALDRLLVDGRYIVPFYDAGGQWVARWDRIGRPAGSPLFGFEGGTLWLAHE